MFEKVPTYNAFRTLELKTPNLHGEDVYALQTALNALGFTVETDGYFGPKTDKITRDAQKALGIISDGKVGPVTQKTMVLAIGIPICTALNVPNEALRGQVEGESGFILGNYSPPRPAGDFDAGVAQRNTAHTPAETGFKVEPSLRALLQNTRRHFELFEGVKPLRRRWALAQGAWNAPAFACYIAREEGATKVTSSMVLRPSFTSRTTFEAYVTKVSKYLTV